VATPVIEARDLTKHYGATVGVEGLDLIIERGEVFGFLGPNGAGKTTTIKLLLDLIAPTRGEVLVFGRSPRDPATRQAIGYLPGELSLDERFTGKRMLEFLDSLRPAGRAPADPKCRAALCERLYLTAADLARPIREDSRGTKQRIGLVSAFQHNPDLLILDEPTTGLDPLVRESVFELLAKAGQDGRTVFHSSHVLSEVDRTCTRVAVLHAGRLRALERVDEMRRRAKRKMTVRFGVPAPLTELSLPGVSVVSADGSDVELRVSGELDPLLRVLARYPVKDLAFREPSLEEAFVQYYRGNQVEDA